jgi:hypothetical protein
MGFWGVIAGVGVGVAGTAVVWVFKTLVVRPNLRMSPCISRRMENEEPVWRIKLGNYSWLPAIELSIHAVLRANVTASAISVIDIGLSTDFIDLLPRRALNKPGRHRLVYLDPSHLTPRAIGRLPADLQAKIEHPDGPAGPISLEDLLDIQTAGKPPATLTITAFCFNGLSGTRKYFFKRYVGSAAVQDRAFKKGSLDLAQEP